MSRELQSQGWIKLHRQIQTNPICMKDGDHLAVWVYLLLNATHQEYDSVFQGQRITLQPGQLITGRQSISRELKISESKVQRILKLFESERQIEQRTSNQNRLLTIRNWIHYQQSEQPTEQQVNNERTTSEQRVNTNKNDKNVKNVKNDKNNNIGKFQKPSIEDIKSYCNERKNTVDAEKFYNYYESNGWKVGKNPMKDWKAAIRTWEQNSYSKPKKFESETNKPYENLF